VQARQSAAHFAASLNVIKKGTMKDKSALIFLVILLSYIAISEVNRHNRNVEIEKLVSSIDAIGLSFDKVRFGEFEYNVGLLTQIDNGNLDDVKASLRFKVEGMLPDAKEHLQAKKEGCCKENLAKVIAAAESQVSERKNL
jgi:hypothetical protein